MNLDIMFVLFMYAVSFIMFDLTIGVDVSPATYLLFFVFALVFMIYQKRIVFKE